MAQLTTEMCSKCHSLINWDGTPNPICNKCAKLEESAPSASSNTTQAAIALLKRWVSPGNPDETLTSDTYHFLNNDATAAVR